jgi:RNA polymerase sigma-70 factor (ECF subfamily)
VEGEPVPAGALEDAPDAFLVLRATDGDTRAFEVLVRRYAGLMRAYAVRLTRSPADADDAVQEAFITAWDTIDTLNDPAAVKPWLMRVVSRKSIDRVRARRGDAALEDWDAPAPDSSGPEQRVLVHSQLEAVVGILDRLPEMQRQCWVLKESGGYSYQEIAEELDVPVPTVRGALARARRALIRGLEDWA